MEVIMLAKANNLFCDYAERLLHSAFDSEEILVKRGFVGDPLDEGLPALRADYVLSFLSPWIVPAPLLRSAQRAALNFHPGPPNYPGSGCYNFALYEGATEYGITCHHMREKVDTGSIVRTSYFPVSKNETVESLKLKSMNHMLYCFQEIVALLRDHLPLPASQEQWLRKPFTKQEMFALSRIDPATMSEAEMQRRVRAAAYPSFPGAYLEIEGEKKYLDYERRPPIV